MKPSLAPLLSLFNGALAAVYGFDVSNYQPKVDFKAAYNSGARFVMIKATEGKSYIDPTFNTHYTSATNAGLIRGGYHFAHLGSSSGATQAKFFLAHGGGWSPDGMTLPGMLDLEGACVLAADKAVEWIREFSETYFGVTGVYPLLYTSKAWWRECTGDSKGFGETNPLVLARYAEGSGALPGDWLYYTIWQYGDSYPFGGDADVFNGDLEGLRRLAKG